MDKTSEVDDGYVTLVNTVQNVDGSISESMTSTGSWAWKHPHTEGGVTYTPLAVKWFSPI